MQSDVMLFTAIRNGALDDAIAALDSGASPNALVPVGESQVGAPAKLMWPAVTAALMLHRDAIARELIARGADINARDNQQRTPLMWLCAGACSDADLLSFEIALTLGADVRARDGHGLTALDVAAENAHASGMHGPGAHPEYRGSVPLAIVERLLAANAPAARAGTREKVRVARERAARQNGNGPQPDR